MTRPPARRGDLISAAPMGPRIDGFSIFFARSPSWSASARHACAAVESSTSGRSRGMCPSSRYWPRASVQCPGAFSAVCRRGPSTRRRPSYLAAWFPHRRIIAAMATNVLVLGAGASHHYEFPLAAGIVTRVRDRWDAAGGPRMVLWCPRSESNRHAFKGGGFSSHFGLRRPEQSSRSGSWSGARLHHSLAALGARRLLSTPSRMISPVRPDQRGLGSA